MRQIDIGEGRAYSHRAEVESSARLVTIIARAAAAVAAENALDGVCRAIVMQAEALGARFVHLYRAHPERQELHLTAWRHLPDDIVRRLSRVRFDEPLLAAAAARSLELQMVPDARLLQPELAVAREISGRLGAGSLFSAPLLVQGNVVGVLTWGYAEPHLPEGGECTAIQAITEIFAVGLANAEARHSEMLLRQEMEAIRRASLAISTPTGLNEVLQQITDQARGIIGARYAALGVLSSGSSVCSGRWVLSGMSDQEAAALGWSTAPPSSGFVARTAEGASILEVPVRYQGNAVGHLYLMEKKGEGRFHESDRRIIELLVQHAAVAIERASTEERLREEVVERARVESALRESEARFRRLSENAPDIIFRLRLRPEPSFEYVSPAIGRMLGLSPEEICEDAGRLGRLVHSEDRDRLATFLDPELDVAFLSLRWVLPDGRTVWTETRAVPVHDETGQLVAREGISRDVSRRKRAESERNTLHAALEAERAWLRAVIEHSPAGVVLARDNGRVVEANQQAEELMGVKLDPRRGSAQYAGIVRRPNGTPVPEEDLPSSRALRGEIVRAEEQLMRHSDGTLVSVLASAAPIAGRDGSIAGAVVVINDITPLKELERLREEWISIVAHDLRQPVAAISCQAELLARQICPEPHLQRKVDHILSSSRRLARMISDLLDASRLEASRLQIVTRPVEVAALVGATVERLASVVHDHPVRIECDEELPTVEGDPERLEQVLGNLLSNAVRYGYPSAPIDVRVRNEGSGLRISVTNRGDGIEPEQLGRLFERFRRLGRGGSRSIGLGLYIARGLVEAHGGRLRAESRPGDTTTFHIELPQAGAPAGA